MARFPSGQFGFSKAGPLDYAPADEMTLSRFFNAVYAWMAVGLAVTAGVAYWVANFGRALVPLNMGTFLVLFAAQIILVSVISGAVNRISAGVATALFVLYAALNGITLSILFWVYTASSLGSVFLICALMFGATSIFGFVTKTDLTRFGSFLMMALIGIVVASLVNLFWHNPMLYWLVSYGGVVLFVALTAFDTQRLKIIAAQTSGNVAMANRMAINGSLALYLDFINLFLFLLRILGNRRN